MDINITLHRVPIEYQQRFFIVISLNTFLFNFPTYDCSSSIFPTRRHLCLVC